MQIAKTFQLGLLVTLGSFNFSMAIAADSCSGRVNGVNQYADTIEVAKGHTMTVFMSNNITTSDNSANNAAGKCGGYAITTPDGKTRVVGVCARKTKDGDSWSDEWVMEPGAQRGSWKLTGGTGVFAGKKWSGWWEPVMDDGKMFMGNWGGNCN